MAGPAEPGENEGRALPDDLGVQLTADEGETLRARRGYVGIELFKGQVFDRRYVIGDPLGSGGSGRVYRADDRITSRAVALKLIRTDKLVSADARARLIKEAVTARDVRHPNVVAVYDIGEADGQPYITMECLIGKSLRDWTRERLRSEVECSLETALAIVNGVLDGLDAAHALGVIHRDLKPENVFLTGLDEAGPPKVKLLDFGIARAGGGRTDSTSSPTGTPHYMAPEQITAPDVARPSADIYSLSVIFYELLVGVLPQGYWQPPSQGRQDVPQSVDKLIEAGLANRPRSRPQSAEDYRKALRAALAQTPQPQSNASGANPGGAIPGGANPWTQTKPAAPRDGAEEARLMRLEAQKSLDGDGAPEDKVKARKLFAAAAEGGDAMAMSMSGYVLEHGLGGAVNLVEARNWYRRAAEKGLPVGIYNYAQALGRGLGGPKDEAGARALYLKSAEAGHISGMYNYAVYLESGKGGPLDQAGARLWYRKAAEAGDGDAMSNYGLMLQAGEGGPKDDAGARSWFAKAAAMNHVAGMCNFAHALNKGVGGPANAAEARAWYGKAAETGHARSMMFYGAMLADGLGGPADPVKAADWLAKAADAGEPKAREALAKLNQATPAPSPAPSPAPPSTPPLPASSQSKGQSDLTPADLRELAHKHFSGAGALLDKVEARRLFGLAAEAGDPSAMCNYGWMIEKGEGGEANEAKARAWYLKSAEAGQTQGMINYAGLVRAGVGGPRNEAEALAWYRKAASLGEKDAAAAARMLEARVDPAKASAQERLHQQLAKAMALATEARARASRQDASWANFWNEAHTLHKQALASGDPLAKLSYGRFLAEGVSGVWPAKPELARQWLESAAKDGSSEAAAALKAIGGG